MRRRCQFFAALLAIALQALDAVVGGLGHSHEHDRFSTAICKDHDPGCSHDHDAAPQPASSEDDPHDDCSLCRHFSQPTAPIAATIELVGSERVEPFVLWFTAPGVAGPISAHLARGPPASRA